MKWTPSNSCRAHRLHSGALFLVLAGCFTPSVAEAQDNQTADRANAIEFFDKAAALEQSGNYSEACPKYAESYRLDPKLGALLHLADCYEHNGQLASAYAAFREASELAAKLGDKRLAVANERSHALEAKVPHLFVKVDSKDTGLELSKDGRPLSAAQWGTELALDPGQHSIEATAPGKQPWKTAINVPASGQTVTVIVPALANAASSPAVASSAAAPVATNYSPSTMSLGNDATGPGQDQQGPALNQRTVGYVVGGVGVVGLAMGTVFGLKVNSKNSKSDSICPTGQPCTLSEQANYNSSVSDARSARAASLVSFGVGGAALATGAILIFTAPKSNHTAVSFVPIVDVGRAGATLQGAW